MKRRRSGKNNSGDSMNFFKKESLLTAGAGLAVGLVNGLLGAGGGIIAVRFCKDWDLSASRRMQMPLRSFCR